MFVIVTETAAVRNPPAVSMIGVFSKPVYPTLVLLDCEGVGVLNIKFVAVPSFNFPTDISGSK